MLMNDKEMDLDKLEAEIISTKLNYSRAIQLLTTCYPSVNVKLQGIIETAIDTWCNSNQHCAYIKSVNNIHLIPKKSRPVL